MSRVCKIKVSMSMMSSIEQARWFVREKKGKAKEEAEEQKSSIPGQEQQMQRLGISNKCGFPGGSDAKESACNVGYLEKGMATHYSILVWRIP